MSSATPPPPTRKMAVDHFKVQFFNHARVEILLILDIFLLQFVAFIFDNIN